MSTPTSSVVGFNWQGMVPYIVGGVAVWYVLPKPLKFLAGAGALYLYKRHEAQIAAAAAAALARAKKKPIPTQPPSVVPDGFSPEIIDGVAQVLIGG